MISIVFSKCDLAGEGAKFFNNKFLKKPNLPKYAKVLVVKWVKPNTVTALLSPPLYQVSGTNSGELINSADLSISFLPAYSVKPNQERFFNQCRLTFGNTSNGTIGFYQNQLKYEILDTTRSSMICKIDHTKFGLTSQAWIKLKHIKHSLVLIKKIVPMIKQTHWDGQSLSHQLFWTVYKSSNHRNELFLCFPTLY